MNIRVIPRLDIKGPNLVKGIHFEGLRVLGKPEKFAQHYYESGADELLYMDAVASLYGRNSLLHIVEKLANKIFIPLTVGGGLRSVEDVRQVLRAGADKVSINTAAIQRPKLIQEVSQTFGSSTVVVSIEAIRSADGKYECFTDFGREHTGINVKEWSQLAVEMGAGEIMITSIDRDGTGLGFDCDLVSQVANSVTVPVICSGGAGKITHIVDILNQSNVNAVCLASILHYEYAKRCEFKVNEFSQEGNTESLKNGASFTKIKPASIHLIKKTLQAANIKCRM
jgi:imidazole glycerol-phosphate synthase subunit HisF